MLLRKQAWIILLIVLSLAACDAFGPLAGTSAPATSTPDNQSTSAAVTTLVPGTPDGAGVPSQPSGTITLQVWLPPEFDPDGGTPAGDLLKARLEEFSAQNPGVSIEVRLKAVKRRGWVA